LDSGRFSDSCTGDSGGGHRRPAGAVNLVADSAGRAGEWTYGDSRSDSGRSRGCRLAGHNHVSMGSLRNWPENNRDQPGDEHRPTATRSEGGAGGQGGGQTLPAVGETTSTRVKSDNSQNQTQPSGKTSGSSQDSQKSQVNTAIGSGNPPAALSIKPDIGIRQGDQFKGQVAGTAKIIITDPKTVWNEDDTLCDCRIAHASQIYISHTSGSDPMPR